MPSAGFILFALLVQPIASLNLFIYGLGNVGRAVAEGVPDHWSVRGTKKSCERENEGIAVPFRAAPSYVCEASHILITIPPSQEICQIILADLTLHLKRSSWVGFVSTTGVYGDHSGQLVTEESPLLCEDTSSAAAYLNMELELKKYSDDQGWALAVFRCSGLYGPSRSAMHTLWKQGFPKNRDPSDITNRIHEVDVARAIISAIEKGCTGVFNLSDDEPASRYTVMEYASRLLEENGLSSPVQQIDDEERKPTNQSGRRGKDRKAVSNSRMKAELLDGKITYPSYREGLRAIFQNENNPWWLETDTGDSRFEKTGNSCNK